MAIRMRQRWRVVALRIAKLNASFVVSIIGVTIDGLDSTDFPLLSCSKTERTEESEQCYASSSVTASAFGGT